MRRGGTKKTQNKKQKNRNATTRFKYIPHEFAKHVYELGRNPVSTRFSLSMEMSRLTRDGTAEPVSRDQILRHARGQGNIIFPVQLTTSRIGNLFYPVDLYSAICDDDTYSKYLLCDTVCGTPDNFGRSIITM